MNGPTSDPEALLASWLRPQARGISSLGELVCFGTRTGTDRKANQDRVLVARFADSRSGLADLYVVCDGMGGMAEGATCAEVGITNFVVSLVALITSGRPAPAALLEAAQHANRRVFSLFGGRGGTTLVALLQIAGALTACCVGDSRLLFIKVDGSSRQLSRDDTMKGALDAIGQAPAQGSPEHDRLVQFVGMGQDLQPHVFPVGDLASCRFLLLATDGAYRVTGEALSSIAKHATAPRQVVERTLHVADWVGGADDATMIALAGRSLKAPSNDEPSGLVRIWGPAQQQLALCVPEQQSKPVPSAQRPPTPPANQHHRGKRPPKPKKRRQQEALPLPSPGELIIKVGAGPDATRADANEEHATEPEQESGTEGTERLRTHDDPGRVRDGDG